MNLSCLRRVFKIGEKGQNRHKEKLRIPLSLSFHSSGLSSNPSWPLVASDTLYHLSRPIRCQNIESLLDYIKNNTDLLFQCTGKNSINEK